MFDTIYKDVVYDKLRSSVLLEFRHNLLATEIEISVSLMDNRITSVSTDTLESADTTTVNHQEI